MYASTRRGCACLTDMQMEYIGIVCHEHVGRLFNCLRSFPAKLKAAWLQVVRAHRDSC